MADQISDLYVLLRADTGQLIGGFTEASVSGEEMAAKIAAVTANVEAEIVRMNESLLSVGAAADEMALQSNADMEAMSLKTKKMSLDFEAMAVKAEASTMAIGAATAKAEADTAKTAAANTATMVKVGLGIAAAGAIVIGATANMAGDFESATNRIVVSAGETQSNLAMVRQGILEMAGQVGDSAMDLAKAGYAIESMGYHGQAALDALKAAAQGAKAENADLNTVAKGLTATMNDYGPKVGDAATVMSKLVAAVSDAGTTFEDFTGALHNILPLASAMNVPFEDITGALAEMTAHGMSADQASQNLANSLRSLQKPSQDQTQYLAQIGITASDLTDKLSTRGLTGTLNDISQAIMNKMGPSGKVLISAFNQSKTATQDLQTMLQNMPRSLQQTATAFLNGTITVQDWRQAVKALPADQQGMATQFATLANKADGFNNILKQGGPEAQSYAQAMQRATGTATSLNAALMLTGQNTAATTKAVKDITGATKDADGSVKGWSEVQSTFNQKMDEAKAALGALGIQLGQIFLPVLGDFVKALADAAKWMGQHPALIKAIAIAIGILTVVALVFAAAMVIVNIAMLPEIGIMLAITAVVLAVIAVIALLIFIVITVKDHWSDIVDFFSGVWDAVKNAFKTAIDWIGDRIGDVIDWFKSLPKKIGDGLSSLGSTIGNIAKNAWDSFTKFISDGFENGLKFFKDFPKKAGFAIGYLVGTLAKKGKEAWDSFTHAVETAWDDTVQWFKDIPKNIDGLMKDAARWLLGPGKDMVNGWIDGVNQKWKDFTNWLSNLPSAIGQWFKDAGKWLYDQGMAIIHGAADGITGAWHDFTGWLNRTFPDGITQWFKDAGKWLYNTGADILHGLWNGFKSMMGWIYDQISGFIDGLISGVKAGFDSHSPSRVFHSIGEDLMNGLGNGINAKAGEVLAIAKKTSQQVVGATSGEFQVNGTLGLAANASGLATGIASRGNQGGQVVINVTVQGNIRTTQQFVREMQQELLRYGIRNFGNGSTYLGFGAAS
jgi:TP901 family phage tail tape measure protein